MCQYVTEDTNATSPSRVNTNKTLAGRLTEALLTAATSCSSYNKQHIIYIHYKLPGEPEEIVKKSQLSSHGMGAAGCGDLTPWKP